MNEISSDIPLPPRTRKTPFHLLRDMAVGQSVFWPSDFNSGIFANFRPKRFERRRAEESGVKGFRVWRVE